MPEGRDEIPWVCIAITSFVRGFIKCFWGLKIEGVENVPAGGRVIVAVNHRSNVDPPLVVFALHRKRYTRFIAKQELFSNPVTRWFFRTVGAIALDRTRADVGAVRGAMAILENEGCLTVFPEGTRSKDGRPGTPKAGVGFLAQQSGATVIPARVWDTERFPGRGSLRIKFGSPLKYDGEASKEAYRAFAERVMESIFKL